MKLSILLSSTALAATLITNVAFADNNSMPLNKITFELQQQGWATTDTAKVIVGINATLDQSQLDKLHSQILTSLKTISSKTQWHITTFQRNQDQSGLEKVHAQAEARLPESELAGLDKAVKSISKPGQNFTVDDIQFSPSPIEIEKVRANLRDKIYNQAKAELSVINKTYPRQRYYLHSINFANYQIPGPRPMVLAAKAADQKMAVSNRVNLAATITLAANTNSK